MWGYDRSEDTELIPYKNQDQHFKLFCMVLEKGFAVHTGHSERLIVDYKLSDAGSSRYLPRLSPKDGLSFRIPENCLRPADIYLHYDPERESDLPELAIYRREENCFEAVDHEAMGLFEPEPPSELALPIVKLSTLRGLHYIKDIACLQMFQLDFDKLSNADKALTSQVRELLIGKLKTFVNFTQPWQQADRAEKAAKDYLEQSQIRKQAKKPPAKLDDQGFMTWE